MKIADIHLASLLRGIVSLLFAFVFIHGGMAQAVAQDVASSFLPLNEIRVGAMIHDVEGLDLDERRNVDLNGELLFAPFASFDRNSWWDVFLSPRLHVGGTASFNGETSVLYAGFTWDIPLGDTFFFETSFGGAVHNGDLSHYGGSVNFRETASLGINIDDSWRIMGTISHMSNAGIYENNGGLTNAGVRLGYKFN
jgi:hypothetical protein